MRRSVPAPCSSNECNLLSVRFHYLCLLVIGVVVVLWQQGPVSPRGQIVLQAAVALGIDIAWKNMLVFAIFSFFFVIHEPGENLTVTADQTQRHRQPNQTMQGSQHHQS